MGKFGTVETIDGHKMKTTKRFLKTKQKEQAQDAFYHDRVLDATLYHPFILPVETVMVDPDSKDEEKYSQGLKIIMPLCTFSYKDDSGNTQSMESHLDSLFEIYKLQKGTPEWVAYVGETVLNLATALSYLHSQGLVHLDIKGNNILVHTSSPLEKLVTAELFDRTEVYLADRGGANLSWYIVSLERSSAKEPPLDDDSSSHLEESKIDRDLSYNATPLRQQQVDIQQLGAVAAYLLTGAPIIKIKKNAHDLDQSVYLKYNPLLSSALSLIKALRKTGNVEHQDIDLEEDDRLYTSVQEFIDTFSAALGKHFYVARRANLPEQVQEKLGTRDIGYIVCTPERFMQLMYVGRVLQESEYDDAVKIASNPYQNAEVFLASKISLSLPTTQLGSIPPDLSGLIKQISEEQLGHAQRLDNADLDKIEQETSIITASEAKINEIGKNRQEREPYLKKLGGMLHA